MQPGGGPAPEPVSSYVTSTPDDVNTRITVCPVQEAVGKLLLHILTTTLCPADAITPHVGSLSVSVLVFFALHAPQSCTLVAAGVGTEVG